MAAIESLKSIPGRFAKLNMSLLPTPLQRLENLSRELGVEIYCKRDDLTGFAMGGNKTRKLDYIIPDAIAAGADSIVTFGSNQSNWCRMTSAAGSAFGLEVYLILAGRKPSKPTANLRLDLLSGAQVIHIDTEEEEILVAAAEEKAEELKRSGRRPYYVAVGGSNPVGTLGYITAFDEILGQGVAKGIRFSRMIVASGSAGTQAGLVAGKVISGWEGEIIGMTVSRSAGEQEDKLNELVSGTLSFIGHAHSGEEVNGAITCDDSYLGEGYRRNTASCAEAISMFAKSEGIFLDEVYTGKAAAGLIDYARRGIFMPGENVLFIHTGGAIQLLE